MVAAETVMALFRACPRVLCGASAGVFAPGLEKGRSDKERGSETNPTGQGKKAREFLTPYAPTVLTLCGPSATIPLG